VRDLLKTRGVSFAGGDPCAVAGLSLCLMMAAPPLSAAPHQPFGDQLPPVIVPSSPGGIVVGARG